jgi:hypothetical protein
LELLKKIKFKYMASNTGQNSRKGAVKSRSQVFNPSTGNYIKRDTNTGKFIEVKSDGKPFKGVKKETVIIRANPNIDKETAQKAENAVINLFNKRKDNK